jgi:hypothetical protein
MSKMTDFTDADLIEMAGDCIFALLDRFPNAADLAWARLDERYEAEKLEALADVQRTHGAGYKAAVEVANRIVLLTAERDGAQLKGMTGVAGRLLGLMAPAGREAARNVLKGLPPRR